MAIEPPTAPVLLLALLCAIPATATAQENDDRWRTSVQAHGTILFGNTEQRVLGSRASVTRRDSRAELSVDLQNVYGETRDIEGRHAVTKRLWLGTFTTDLNPETAVSPFVFLTAESNLEKRIRERYSAGAGAKRTFIRDERRELSLSLAVLEERTLPLAVTGAPVATRLTRWSARGRIRHRWGERARFSHVTFWQPAIDNIASFLVRSTTEMEYVLTEVVSVTGTFVDNYDSEAVRRGAVAYNDGQIVFGIRAAW